MLNERLFQALDQITQDGIEAGMWGVYDFGEDGVSSKDYFGTDKDVTLKGKMLVVYEDIINTNYFFMQFDKSDLSLPCGDDQNIHFWKFEV